MFGLKRIVVLLRKGPHLTLGSSGSGNLTRADPSHSSIVLPRHATENRDIPVDALSFCNAQKSLFFSFLSCLFLVVSKKLIFKETLLLAHLFTLHPTSVNFGRRRLPKRCLHGWLIFGTSSVGIFVEAWVYLSVPGPQQYLAAW